MTIGTQNIDPLDIVSTEVAIHGTSDYYSIVAGTGAEAGRYYLEASESGHPETVQVDLTITLADNSVVTDTKTFAITTSAVEPSVRLTLSPYTTYGNAVCQIAESANGYDLVVNGYGLTNSGSNYPKAASLGCDLLGIDSNNVNSIEYSLSSESEYNTYSLRTTSGTKYLCGSNSLSGENEVTITVTVTMNDNTVYTDSAVVDISHVRMATPGTLTLTQTNGAMTLGQDNKYHVPVGTTVNFHIADSANSYIVPDSGYKMYVDTFEAGTEYDSVDLFENYDNALGVENGVALLRNFDNSGPGLDFSLLTQTVDEGELRFWVEYQDSGVPRERRVALPIVVEAVS